MDSKILGPDGKPASSQEVTVCPTCGRNASEFHKSGGFGIIWPVCPCGREFKEQKCPNAIR